MNADLIIDVIKDAMIDNIKILPFLFVTFLLMEYLEDKMQEKTKDVLKGAGKIGPLWGSLLGIVPQCGFSAAASNLYAGRVITTGTLIAIYLSTSDEMLPIMISNAVSPLLILKVLVYKVVIGMVAGFLIDFFLRYVLKKKEREVDIHHFCEQEHCECGHGILRPALIHTIKIFLFLLLVSLVLGFVIEIFGLESISSSFLSDPFLGPIMSGFIGLIPNCAASVVITEFFLEGAITFGTMISGLLVGAGVGILVLIRVNDDRKANAFIITALYMLGVISGIVINLVMH